MSCAWSYPLATESLEQTGYVNVVRIRSNLRVLRRIRLRAVTVSAPDALGARSFSDRHPLPFNPQPAMDEFRLERNLDAITKTYEIRRERCAECHT